MFIKYHGVENIPVIAEADVVVVGGGPGGLAAAVVAARQGVKVILVERYGFLGGMAASGEVHPFMMNHVDGTTLDRPIYVEWRQAMRQYLPESQRQTPFDTTLASWSDNGINKNVAMLAAEDLCLAAGVKLLYHHNLLDVIMVDGRIEAAVFNSKSGLGAICGKVFVDSTGDADLAALAKCGFEFGNEDGWCQPMTLCFKLGHVDKKLLPAWGEIQRLYTEAKANGEVSCPRENLLVFQTEDEDVYHFNTTRVIKKSGINGQELSEAEIEARRQLREILAFLRRRVPGYAQATIHSIAHHIGIRETRRVRGMAYLTLADFEARRKFPDAIAKVNYSIDIHNPSGSGTVIREMPQDDWYEIPYGCIVPPDCRNLLIGSRSISADHAVHSSMRVMPPVCSIGQAAGMAAVMSIAGGIDPSQVDGKEVRRRLVAIGARL